MAVAVAITSIVATDPSLGLDATQNELIVDGTLTLSANYGGASSHGDTVNFGTLDLIKSNQPPRRVEIYENQGSASTGVGNAPLGYTYIYCQGTTIADGLLQVLGGNASPSAVKGATEFTQAAAYSSGTPSLNGAVLRFRAYFPKFG